MKLLIQTPKKTLKAFLKQRPLESERDKFKTNLNALLDKITVIEKQPKDESEEHLKNNLRDFLRDTYYIDTNAINTKDKKDLVIHLGKTTDTDVAVIIEAKRPSNVKEMISADNVNKKAFHELILYYLTERNANENIKLKQLIATDINQWFIIDANYFDKHIYRNTQIRELYETKVNDKKDNPWFYEELAKIVSKIDVEIPCVYFDIRDYKKILSNTKSDDDKELVALYKILSPQHLLKIDTPNDSNTLNERFYKELLHIIGLEEAREGTKNVIRRKKENKNTASLIELVIDALKTNDPFHHISDIKVYGENREEQAFNIALELCITWINRILFLKLLEGQLISYHQGNKHYRFLNSETIHDYDELFILFHKVLAVNIPDRTEDIKEKYRHVPYLNSSLFEISELEDQTIKINSLRNDGKLELLTTTVLKDIKKKTDKLLSLDYLFQFLDAYDFASEGTEDWQKDNKQLINASVLGKVFEKINGYRDGSIFTPAFITMYMCRQSIRLGVLEKFNTIDTPLLRGAGGVPFTQIQVDKGAIRRQIIPYNPALKELARDLRNNSTKSEIHLWLQLKGKVNGKYDFHRQKPIDNYIADFFCHELSLVIELDGITHNWEETQAKDYEKECRFNQLGLNVLRFTDKEVLSKNSSVFKTILAYIEAFENNDKLAFAYEDTPLNPLSRGDFMIPNNNLTVDAGTNNNIKRFENFDALKNFTRKHINPQDILSLNEIINSLHICDPAVGSGHFLVSALNEIIAIKAELGILADEKGNLLSGYEIEIVNDELIITDQQGSPVEYKLQNRKPINKEIQRLQKTLFHEKQTIIENCLFGVDINPKSVLICRLRLWIELLKNAYYKEHLSDYREHLPNPPQGGNVYGDFQGGNEIETHLMKEVSSKTPLFRGAGGVSFSELETLPNIDINIKCGNSLLSRFALDADLSKALKSIKYDIKAYRSFVNNYKNEKSREVKRGLQKIIDSIKSDFRTEIFNNDPKVKKLKKLQYDYNLLVAPNIFKDNIISEPEEIYGSKENAKKAKQRIKKLEEEIKILEKEIEEIKTNALYKNAFEWRFEFPEVLNNNGEFEGFDLVIGNPPYGAEISNRDILKELFPSTSVGQIDTYKYFIELCFRIVTKRGIATYITSDSYLEKKYFKDVRIIMNKNASSLRNIKLGDDIFEGINLPTAIFQIKKGNSSKYYEYKDISRIEGNSKKENLLYDNEGFNTMAPEFETSFSIKTSILKNSNCIKLIDAYEQVMGVKVYQVGKGKPKQTSYEIKNNTFISTKKIDINYYKFISQGIERYKYIWQGEWIKYGEWLAEPRQLKFFTNPKIIIREIVNPRIFAAYIEEKAVVKNIAAVIIEKDKNFSLKYLLALINSSLFTYYLFEQTPKSSNKSYPSFTSELIKNIPIKKISLEQQQPFITLVEKIISLKQEGKDTSEQEREIDQLVYKLYDITPDEQRSIEEN